MGRKTSTLFLLAAALLPVVVLAKPGRLQVIEDGETPRPDRFVHDVKHVSFEVLPDAVEVMVQFRKDFSEMMFQAVEVFLDCDDSDATGIGGAELLVRSAVGSRFRPNSAPAVGEGVRPPLMERKAGYADLRKFRAGAEAAVRLSWVWRNTLPPPEIQGAKLIQRIPRKLLRDHGLVYNRHVPVRIQVEGSCSESPIPLMHLVTDEGVGIEADGEPSDWSGGTVARDEPGELHRDAATLDITEVRVDHRKDVLLVGVWLEKAGFGTYLPDSDSDIRDADRVTVSVEPLGGEYLGYRSYQIFSSSRRVDSQDWGAVVGDRFIEFVIRRPPTQNSFRVIVWSDAIRYDNIPEEGTFRLDLGGDR